MKKLRETGQGLVEYLMVVMLVAIAALAVMIFYAPHVENMYQDLTSDETVGKSQGSVSSVLY